MNEWYDKESYLYWIFGLCIGNNFTCVNLGIHTPFLLWITYFLHCNWYLFCTLNFSSLNNLFFFIVIDNCEEKLALWHIAKCDSIEGLFTDYFCLIIWYSTGSCLSCYYFCKKKMVYIINPCFSRLFIQFSKTVLAVQWILNQLESSINLHYWDFAI